MTGQAYRVRVTRDLDGEYCDFDVTANSWEEAKRQAIADASGHPDRYYSDLPEPDFAVDPMDDHEESAKIEYEGAW